MSLARMPTLAAIALSVAACAQGSIDPPPAISPQVKRYVQIEVAAAACQRGDGLFGNLSASDREVAACILRRAAQADVCEISEANWAALTYAVGDGAYPITKDELGRGAEVLRQLCGKSFKVGPLTDPSRLVRARMAWLYISFSQSMK